MVFSSLLFIIYFLPIVLIAYYSLKNYRNIVLLIASLFFYAFGEPVYIILLLFSSSIDFLLSKKLGKEDNEFKRKIYLLVSVVMNLGLLGFFKYGDFLIANVNSLTGLSINLMDLPLPIGISFYSFQTLSYTIDVYRKRVEPQKRYIDFTMYVSMFPQLIAGPIVRYIDVEKQIKTRKHSLTNIEEGMKRFIMGLSKKVLLADQMALLNVTLLKTEGSVLGYWLAIIAFALQIYFDFSGYSDMAIGLGKMFGFDLLENFNYPYISKSISEFWRRWHISLGNWFKDYLYFPLGGSKVSKNKVVRNLLIVWLLTGLWHGASWNYILWGIYFGFFIVMEKTLLKNILDKVPALIRHIYTLLVVLFGWVIFSLEDLSKQIIVYKGMLGIDVPLFNEESIFYFRQYLIILIISLICSLPVIKHIRVPYKLKIALYVILFIVTVSFIVDSSFSPFIYFRF
ncbi:MBOAT family O-acyltransferase [Mycoplasmatota bacterium zrk1]